MKIVFFGTPQFSANVLEYLLEKGVEVVAIVTRTDKPKGRALTPMPPPVKNLVLQKNLNIPLFQPEKISDPESAKWLAPFNADLFVVVAYGEILKQNILDMPKLACINLHASLLPKYRGAAPIQRCIMEGEAQTGITIMHMVRKMDAGDMIKSVKVPIGANETYGEIEKKLCDVGSQALFEVIKNFTVYDANRKSQEESLVTFAPKLELEDCEIDWKKPAKTLHDLVRGVNPYPGAWCYVETKGTKKRLKIVTTTLETVDKAKPGDILSCSPEGLVVGCGEGALRIVTLQLEGKKAMTPNELLRGSSLKFLVKSLEV